jgi:hypothetical protein
MALIISSKEYQKICQLKELEIQVCSLCGRLTILNLGWAAFPQLFCQACQGEHVLCPELCLKAARNILGCHLYQEYRPVVREVVPVNRAYDWCACYGCGKELRGAGKTGRIKNRNNPSFWGIKSEWKILCLGCLGKKYLGQLTPSKRKTFKKYLRRGYV